MNGSNAVRPVTTVVTGLTAFEPCNKVVILPYYTEVADSQRGRNRAKGEMIIVKRLNPRIRRLVQWRMHIK